MTIKNSLLLILSAFAILLIGIVIGADTERDARCYIEHDGIKMKVLRVEDLK